MLSSAYSTSTHPVAGPSNPVAASSSVAGPALSSLPSGLAATPELIQKMTNAATSNPTLLKLLTEVAEGNATQDQKETLELLLRTFKSSSSSSAQSQATSAALLTPSMR